MEDVKIMIKKRTLRVWAAIFILLLAFCATIGASAENESVYDKNNALLSERYSALLTLKAENSDTEAGRNVNNFIDKYASLMNNITPERLSEESASELIELYYAQGEIAGRVAWIYYTYVSELDDDARAAVDRVHTGVHTDEEDVDGIQDEIAKANNADDLREAELLSYNNGGLLARIYVAVYTERLDSLILPEDTELVSEIIWGETGAVASIKQSKTVATAEYYDEIYSKAAADIIIRRNKDTAISEITEAYGIIYPDGDYKTEDSVTEAIENINKDEVLLPSRMNLEIKNAIFELFDKVCEENGDFVKAYINEMKLSVSDEISLADVEGRIAGLSVAFGEYELDFSKAEAKDIINEDISSKGFASDSIMQTLADEYCAESGVIDGCDRVEKVDNELLKARDRILLYEKYKESVADIVGFVGEGDISKRAEESYLSSDASLKAVDSDAEGYITELEKSFANACDALELLVTEAEVKAYEPKHTYIINKDIKEVALTDKAAIVAAINDMSALGEGAQGVFEELEIPDDLAAKYKKIARLEVEQALGQTAGQRKNAADKLCVQIDALSVSGRADALASLVEKADGIVLKAKETDAVISRYEEIISSAEYSDFAKSDKDTILSIADGTVTAIADTKAGEDLVATVKALSGDGVIALNRAEACARIDAVAASRADVKDAVTNQSVKEIVAKAKQSVGGETDADEIERLADAAIFDVSKEFDLYDMKVKADEANAAIAALDVLDLEQKGEFLSKTDTALAEQSDILREAKNDAVRISAKRDLETRMTTIVEDSKRENEAQRIAKRVEFGELLKTDYNEAVLAVEGMLFLNPDERDVYISGLDEVLEKGLEDIEASDVPAQMEEAERLASADMDEIIAEGSLADLAAGGERRAISNGDLRVYGNSLIEEIKSLQYLSEEEKLVSEQGIISVLDNYSASLDTLTSAEKLAESEAAAYGVLNNINRECELRDLAEAKSAAILEITNKKNEIEGRIDKFDFLDDSVKEELKTEPKALLSYAKQEMKERDGIDDVHALRDEIMNKLDSHESRARKRENEACVKALTPVMIALAVAFGVLAVAAAILGLAVKKKRGAVFARCALPFTMLAVMMPSALAWVITVLLALLDLALVALIVYFVIRLVGKNAFGGFFGGDDDYLEPAQEDDRYTGEAETEEGFDNNTAFIIEEFEGKAVEEEKSCGVAVLPERKKAPALAERKRSPALKAVPSLARLFAPPARLRIEPGPQIIYLMPPSTPEILESVTVEEADRMMTDEEAFSYEETNMINAEVYSGRKKAVVNVDAISRAFEAGDVVSINSLKERKLISQNVGWVKILGKGVVDKPLTVIAQNYSASAVKMIVLTGGKAILAEGSPERRK